MSTRVVFPENFAANCTPATQRRRLRLHELEHGFHCSIVGTCLTPATARQIVRRAKLVFEADAQDYRLHSVLVSEAAKPGIVSRLIAKSLDESFAGTLRRVAGTAGAAELAALWDQLCEKGEIAAAYWAFVTHAHVPPELRVRIFGEVHMLSHFMGGHNRAHAKELWLAERRAEQLAERDRKIAELETELAHTRNALARRLTATLAQRRHRAGARGIDAARFERRVLAARARLRQAEQENERLRRQLDLATDGPLAQAGVPRVAVPPPTVPAGGPERCLLYVGGHCALLPHLRRHARDRCLELLHHDGGEEHSLHVLEGLVGRAEAVFCPIDCVSHQACLAAKQMCRRLAKPFVPLRTGSGTCFLRAVDRWRAVAAPGTDAPAPVPDC